MWQGNEYIETTIVVTREWNRDHNDINISYPLEYNPKR